MFWKKKVKNQKDSTQVDRIEKDPIVVDDEIITSFETLETAYDEFQFNVKRRIEDYEYAIKSFRNKLDDMEKKIKAYEVMKEILPTLSFMHNDYREINDCDVLKKAIGSWFRQLKNALQRVGIELKMHEPLDNVDEDENAIITFVPTTDKDLNNKVESTEMIGCVAGEDKILEEIVVYKYSGEDKQDEQSNVIDK